MPTLGTDFANWDLKSFFDEFQGDQYNEFRDAYKRDALSLLDRSAKLGPLTEANAADWAKVVEANEDLARRASHLGCYLHCRVSDNVRDEASEGEANAFYAFLAEPEKIDVHLIAALKDATDAAFAKLVAQPGLTGAEFTLKRLREKAKLSMSAELEALFADLAVNGFHAWGRLRDKIAGLLEFDQKQPDGTVKKVPMSQKNSCLEHPDPFIRKSTMDGSNDAWKSMEDVAGACLNAIAGTRLALYKRRGVKHFLDQALYESNITRKTLDALIGAMADRRELPRRYLRSKAKLLGMEKLGFQDEGAPLPLKNPEKINWAGAKNMVLKSFNATYPAMGAFAQMAFDKNWIESEPRAGKMPGGYCNSSYMTGQPVIYMTYNDTLGDVLTLAHELGHCFHEWQLKETRVLARVYPMTLAETASTFAEATLTDAILADPKTSDRDRAVILDTNLQRAASFMLNIPMRFAFEKAFYEERAEGDVSVSRLKKLTIEAQKEWFGDAIREDELDPYFWASKGHFFITGMSFYNFPYSFGYLFSMGVFARFKKEGASFLPKYENLLKLSGGDTAENVAKKALGIDLESKEFWLESIDLVEKDLKAFEEIAPKVVAAERA